MEPSGDIDEIDRYSFKNKRHFGGLGFVPANGQIVSNDIK